MARRPTHGVRQLARQLGVVGSDAAELRMRDTDRRTLRRLGRELSRDTLEAIRISTQASYVNGLLLCQRCDLALINATDLPSQTGLGKLSTWLHNRRRRDAELLLLIEQRLADRRETATTCGHCGKTLTDDEFLLHRCERQPAPQGAEPATQTASGEVDDEDGDEK